MKFYQQLIRRSLIPLIIGALILNGCKKNASNPQTPAAPNNNPSISSITPSSGPFNTVDTIVGSGFTNSDTLEFNGMIATIISQSADTIIAKVPAASGTGLVTIAGNGFTVSGPVFTYYPTAVVSTFAGNGQMGLVDGAAGTAEFKYPVGIAIDGQNDLFVADAQNNVIRKITPDGTVSTLAGNGSNGFVNGQGTNAQFFWPYGIAIDGQGNLYVADANNNAVRFITPSGLVSTLAGNGTAGYIDSSNANAEFNSPVGITVDNNGNVFVADANNNAIRQISQLGLVTTVAGNGQQGNINGSSKTAEFHTPEGVVTDGQGNLFVADTYNNIVRKITSAGVVSTVAGSGTSGFLDGQNISAEFALPSGICLDANQNIYIGDYFNARLRIISPSGAVGTLAGNGTHALVNGDSIAAEFYSPWGIAIDKNGFIYVADSRNNVIRKIIMK